jgi:predicted adenine nucleotide alpha hydrolase (AANH) superfamily ATPase
MNDRLLLHVCCAPDATVAFERLYQDWHVIGYFFNPNIHPADEYSKRLAEFMRLGCAMGMEVRSGEYLETDWTNAVKGLESEPEKGRRCDVCFRIRMEDTARLAKIEGFDAFATVLTVSPHKNARKINEIGQELSEKYDVHYLETDLKKKDGFKRSVELSRQFGLYRQKYCGCRFSWRDDRAASDVDSI